MVLPAVLRDQARRRPDREYVRSIGGPALTYAEFHDLALRYATGFSRLGVVGGDRVVTMLPPSVESYAGWVGLGWLRAVDTAVNTDYRGRMLAYVLEQSGATVAVVAERWLDRLAEVAPLVPGLATVVVTQAASVPADLPFRALTVDELLEGAPPIDDAEAPRVRDLSCMIYTSGTTGPSKGVLIPWGQMHAFSDGTIPVDDLREDDVFYSMFPVFHGSGRVGAVLMARSGGRVVLREQFSGSEYWGDIRAHGCTTTALVGTMPQFLWSQPARPDDADNPLRRAIMLPVLPQYREFEQRFGVKLRTCYAMTEIAPVFGTDWDIDDPRSCGRPRPGFELRLVDEDDYEVPVGQVGELIVRADEPWTLNAGYFGMPDATAAAWRNGWFHTGDAFRRDEHGNHFFVDRFKDAIRRRGENISSFEVEAHVNTHPEVVESAAVAVPSEWGEDEVKVVVVRSPGSDLSPEGLIAHLVPIMPRFMVPRYVEFVDSLPKTDATHRVRKGELRREPLNSNTWDREKAGIEVPR
jgi:crotonobetaine/carnitine-CoA ligase